MKVGIVNYGMGNLASVRRALQDLGVHAFIAEVPAALGDADRIILPGVGAFPAAMRNLAQQGWCDALRLVIDRGKPLLGICLGMQLLATRGEEGEPTAGLGFIAGTVKRLDAFGCTLRIPHVGWNEIAMMNDDPVFANIPHGSDFYFVHSYALAPDHEESIVATTPYGASLVAAVRKDNVWGVQFHPEKSSKAGKQLLRNFVDYVSC